MNEVNSIALERGKRALLPGVLPLAAALPDRFLFVTISGAHLYGFPSSDSDIDLRGAHVLPLREIAGLRDPVETFESSGGIVGGIEVDCVSHEVRKYLTLLTKKNGYVLEQIFSPLVVCDGGHLEELRSLARGAMTRQVVHHYKGFFRTQEKLVLKQDNPTAKSVLYLFRVVMTGLHLLRTGEVEANILALNELHGFQFIPDLVERKTSGTEKGTLSANEVDGLMDEAKRMEAELDYAFDRSPLPDEVQNFDALHEFVLRVRQITH